MLLAPGPSGSLISRGAASVRTAGRLCAPTCVWEVPSTHPTSTMEVLFFTARATHFPPSLVILFFPSLQREAHMVSLCIETPSRPSFFPALSPPGLLASVILLHIYVWGLLSGRDPQPGTRHPRKLLMISAGGQPLQPFLGFSK